MEPVNPYAPPDPDHGIAPAWQSAPIVESWQRFVPGNEHIASFFSTYTSAHARAVLKLAAMPLWFWMLFGGGSVGLGSVAAVLLLNRDGFGFFFLVGAAVFGWIAIRTYLMRRRVISGLLQTLTAISSTAIEWYEDHLEFVNSNSRTIVRWDGLRKVAWLDGVLTLQVGAVAWFMFPDGLFSPRGAAVVELLRRKLPTPLKQPTVEALSRFFAEALPLRTDQQVMREVFQKQWRRVPILPLESIVLGSQVLAPALGTERWVTRRPDMPPIRSAARTFIERFLAVFGLGLLIGIPLLILASVLAAEFDLNPYWATFVVLVLIVILLPLLFLRIEGRRHARPEGVLISGGVTLFSNEGIYQITIDAVSFTLWEAVIELRQTTSRMVLSTRHGLPIQLERAEFSADDWQRLLTFIPERIAAASRAANDAPSTADEISLMPQSSPMADRSHRDGTDDSGKSARSP